PQLRPQILATGRKPPSRAEEAAPPAPCKPRRATPKDSPMVTQQQDRGEQWPGITVAHWNGSVKFIVNIGYSGCKWWVAHKGAVNVGDLVGVSRGQPLKAL